MTVLQRETYLARAMGRALAHEIGRQAQGQIARQVEVREIERGIDIVAREAAGKHGDQI